jgi:hypothetical protein
MFLLESVTLLLNHVFPPRIVLHDVTPPLVPTSRLHSRRTAWSPRPKYFNFRPIGPILTGIQSTFHNTVTCRPIAKVTAV